MNNKQDLYSTNRNSPAEQVFLEVTIKKQKFEQFWVLTLSSYNNCFVFENYLNKQSYLMYNNILIVYFARFYKAWPIQVHFLRKQKYNLLFIQ